MYNVIVTTINVLEIVVNTLLYEISDFDPHYSTDYSSVGVNDYSAASYPSDYDYQYSDYGTAQAGSPYRADRGSSQRYSHRYYNRPSMVQYAKVGRRQYDAL